MANHFPVAPGMAVASLQYSAAVQAIGGTGASSHIATVTDSIQMLNYGFETGISQDGTGTILLDYSGFDQDAHEASVVSLLDALCGSWASILGQPLLTVQNSVTISRLWTMTAVTPLGGTYPSYPVTERMGYPVFAGAAVLAAAGAVAA